MNKFPIYIMIGSIALFSIAMAGCDLGSSSSGGGGYTISGTITVPGSTAIDSDVNEINTIPKANNTIKEPQELNKNPVIVGGYVNKPEQGEPGNSYDNGDITDVFKIALTKNETVNLYIAEYETANLDLYLYDDNGVIVDPPSTGDNVIEKVQAPSAGTYFVEVKAVSGASNYILTMGQGITEATILDTRLEDDFMPGDIVVKLRPDAQQSFGDSIRSLNDDFMGLRHASGTFEDEIVFKIDADNRQQVFRQLNIPLPKTNRQLFEADDPDVQLKLDTLRTIDALKKRPEVMIAEPNYIRRILEVPNDEYYPLQWHYPLIHLPQAWEVWTTLEDSTGTDEVIVAVIDTGILFNHPDIDTARIADGYDFISQPSISLDGDGIDPNPEDPGDDMEGGSSFHGTHVAGTIGATTNNASGVAGIARNYKIMPLRVLGNGGGLASDIREAIKYAAGMPNNSGIELPPSRRADIINLSLGGSSRSDLDQQTLAAARNAGVIIIAAAGNYASSTPMYPAAYRDEVISVSAVGADKQLAPYSNFGDTIDIAAPGGNMSRDYDGDGHLDGVLSTGGDDESGPIQMVYHFSQGTSMAAPHVAGVVALMKSIEPDLTPDMLDTLIRETLLTEDLEPEGRDNNFGYGLIDAFKAVREVSDGLPTFLFVSPLSLNFGASKTKLLLTAQNFGSENIILVTPTEEETWLTVEEVDEPEPVDQRWTYEVTVKRDELLNGPYAATITLDYEIDFVPKQAQVSVSMQKGIPTGGNAGYHYVLLLDPDTFVAVSQFDVAAPVNGVYPFSLQAVPGEYILFAGTDSDNDYTVGDPGESAGAYISMDQPRVIRLNRDRTGYNFTTSFNLSLPTSLVGDADGYEFHVQREGGFQVIKP